MDWTITKDDQKLSEIVEKASHEGPQRVVRDDESFVVISEQEYRELRSRDASAKNDFLEFLKSGPGLDDLDFSRDKSPMREFDW